MATRAGCASALNIIASLFCLPVKMSVLVNPIQSQYYDILPGGPDLIYQYF